MKTNEAVLNQSTLDRLSRYATGFGKTPDLVINECLNRLEELEKAMAVVVTKQAKPKKQQRPPLRMARLIERGLLMEGQLLTFGEHNGEVIMDHNGSRIQAAVQGDQLALRGTLYSVSALAKELGNKYGKNKRSAYSQGTPHWYDDKGNSLLDLW